ncbi:MAG: HesA/MoeB/ThiF family protein [Rhizobiaceae bacterium]|nr:HesA/MoeB/ThiF family protein [Rhizobiaceae bacterium]
MAASNEDALIMRYARQEILPEIGAAGQAQLQSSHAVIVGAGGLGCPALQYLVAAGLGRITIVDGDTISLTNLHRQTLYREDQTGALKADIAVETLRRLNSDCALKSVPHALTPANAEALLADANIILDCADSFAVSYILSDVCEEKCLPLISASALEFNGYVGGFCGGSPSLRAVFPDLPERAATCATAGVLGPVVGTIGAMQAQMAIAQILGLKHAPLGQLVTLICAITGLVGSGLTTPQNQQKCASASSPPTISTATILLLNCAMRKRLHGPYLQAPTGIVLMILAPMALSRRMGSERFCVAVPAFVHGRPLAVSRPIGTAKFL